MTAGAIRRHPRHIGRRHRRYHRRVTEFQVGSDPNSLGVAFARGDADLRAVYDRHGPLVYSICRKALGESAASEVTQDVFVNAWQARHQYDPERGALGAWLVGIAKRRIIDHVRRERQAVSDVGRRDAGSFIGDRDDLAMDHVERIFAVTALDAVVMQAHTNLQLMPDRPGLLIGQIEHALHALAHEKALVWADKQRGHRRGAVSCAAQHREILHADGLIRRVQHGRDVGAPKAVDLAPAAREIVPVHARSQLEVLLGRIQHVAQHHAGAMIVHAIERAGRIALIGIRAKISF